MNRIANRTALLVSVIDYRPYSLHSVSCCIVTNAAVTLPRLAAESSRATLTPPQILIFSLVSHVETLSVHQQLNLIVVVHPCHHQSVMQRDKPAVSSACRRRVARFSRPASRPSGSSSKVCLFHVFVIVYCCCSS